MLIFSTIVSKICLKKALILITDLLVWSNDRVIVWLKSIGLNEYAKNLIDSGVHGALMVLDPDFDANSFALILQIPNSDVQMRFVVMFYSKLMKFISAKQT